MPKPKTKQYIAELKRLGYEFKMNHTHVIEVNGEPINDAIAAEIRGKMRDAGFSYVRVMEDAYQAYAYRNRYHPVQDYLNGLCWNGQPAIKMLADYFEDTYGSFYPFLRRWLIGACAKAFEAAQNYMLVLDGPQRIGKSYFASWICPDPDLFLEGGIDTGNKDTWLRLCHYWIWEIDELDATTRRADRSALKAFITRRYVTERRSYGRYDITMPALASLIGTINTSGTGFLNDPTGNRRFAVVELLNINHDYATDVDVNQVWAEAYQAYRAGEDWRLTPDERELQSNINEEYEYISPTEEFFHRYYEIDANDSNWMSITDIVSDLEMRGLKVQQHRAVMDLADLFKQEGLEKARKGADRTTRYRGVRPKPASKLGGLP